MLITTIKRALGVPSVLDPHDRSYIKVLKQVKEKIVVQDIIDIDIKALRYFMSDPFQNSQSAHKHLDGMRNYRDRKICDDDVLKWFCDKFLIKTKSLETNFTRVWLLCWNVTIPDDIGKSYKTHLYILRTGLGVWYVCSKGQIEVVKAYLPFGYLIKDNCILKIQYRKQAVDHIIKPALDRAFKV